MLIATLPPVDPRGVAIARHPLVDGLRFNTAMPAPGDKRKVLERLLTICNGKPLWIDLKGRQLRVTKWADPTYEYVELSHRITVDLPATIRFRDQAATVVAVDGNRLVLSDRP